MGEPLMPQEQLPLSREQRLVVGAANISSPIRGVGGIEGKALRPQSRSWALLVGHTQNRQIGLTIRGL
jgi:hypothetical protein